MENRRVVMERTMVMDTCVVTSSTDSRPGLNELRGKIQEASRKLDHAMKEQDAQETELRTVESKIVECDAMVRSRREYYNTELAKVEAEEKELESLREKNKFLDQLKGIIEQQSLDEESEEIARQTESVGVHLQFVKSMLETVRISDRSSDQQFMEAVNQEEKKLKHLEEEISTVELQITETSLFLEENRHLRTQGQELAKAKDFVIELGKLDAAKGLGLKRLEII